MLIAGSWGSRWGEGEVFYRKEIVWETLGYTKLDDGWLYFRDFSDFAGNTGWTP